LFSTVDELSLLPETEEEYGEFIRQFADCTLPKSRWKHGAHLLVALWYVAEHGDDALPLVRLGILKYNESTGVRNTETDGYHETVTVFWVRTVSAFFRHKGNDRPRHVIAADLIAEYSFRKNLYREHYSFDLLQSREARQRWISPDLRPLPL
jgi:hypothetical protein